MPAEAPRNSAAAASESASEGWERVEKGGGQGAGLGAAERSDGATHSAATLRKFGKTGHSFAGRT